MFHQYLQSFFFGFVFTLSQSTAFGQVQIGIPLSPEAGLVQSLLEQPSPDIDFARTRFQIENVIDPTIDVDARVAQIDEIIKIIEGMLEPLASSIQKIEAIKKYIYQSGEWNGFNPYQYDLDDPLGTKDPTNQLVSNYLDDRKGNCVSMPLLFLMLADRMGLDVALAQAPLHVFVKFTDDARGITHNLETTSGANPARNAWYRENLPMTDEAIKNGLYMRPLSRTETVAIMAGVLVDANVNLGQDKKHIRQQATMAIGLANLILKHYPKYAHVMVKKGSAYYLLISDFKKGIPSPQLMMPHERAYLRHLNHQNYLAFKQAEELGWRAEDRR